MFESGKSYRSEEARANMLDGSRADLVYGAVRNASLRAYRLGFRERANTFPSFVLDDHPALNFSVSYLPLLRRHLERACSVVSFADAPRVHHPEYSVVRHFRDQLNILPDASFSRLLLVAVVYPFSSSVLNTGEAYEGDLKNELSSMGVHVVDGEDEEACRRNFFDYLQGLRTKEFDLPLV